MCSRSPIGNHLINRFVMSSSEVFSKHGLRRIPDFPAAAGTQAHGVCVCVCLLRFGPMLLLILGTVIKASTFGCIWSWCLYLCVGLLRSIHECMFRFIYWGCYSSKASPTLCTLLVFLSSVSWLPTAVTGAQDAYFGRRPLRVVGPKPSRCRV